MGYVSIFSHSDKLSQVNTLMQMENIASYPFMADCIKDGRTLIHAMWFDIFTGEIYYFSRSQKVTFYIAKFSEKKYLKSI